MTTINAYKMDGLGNDFLIIDRRESSVNLSKKQIVDFADRKNIGFDLLSIIMKSLPNPSILYALIVAIID